MAIDYESYEFQVYDEINRLIKLLGMKIVSGDELQQLQSEADALRKAFQAKYFRVAVVGGPNREKTSFVNVLLDRKVFSENYTTVTAAVNRITYSDTPGACVVMKDETQMTIPMENLCITRLPDEAEANVSQIKEVVVQCPFLLCKNGVDFIVMPGVDDSEFTSQMSYLENIDFAIVAVDASPPFNMEERLFTELLESPQICQIIVIITKIDMIQERERQNLIDHITDHIKKDVKNQLVVKYGPNSEIMQKYDDIFGNLSVFPISALEALEALPCNDIKLLEKSGFERLKHDLPEIIKISQYNKTILNTEPVLNNILQKYTELLLNNQKQQKTFALALDEMKTKFAQIGHENTSNVFETQDVEFSSLFYDIKEEEAYIRKQFIQALTEMKVLSLAELKRVFLPVMKMLFRDLNEKYHTNERVWNEKYSKNILEPYKASLSKKWEALFQPFPDIYEKMKPEIESSMECLELMKPETQEESFYWVESPIPSEAKLPPDWNIMSYVDSAIQYDLEDYQKRRQKQIEGLFGQSQKRLDNRIEELANRLSTWIEIYIGQENREEEVQDILNKLSQLNYKGQERRKKFKREKMKR